jgi:hypothetical protein
MMDVRTRDMPELIVLDYNALWLRTNLLPAEIIGRLGIMLASVSISDVVAWPQ